MNEAGRGIDCGKFNRRTFEWMIIDSGGSYQSDVQPIYFMHNDSMRCLMSAARPRRDTRGY